MAEAGVELFADAVELGAVGWSETAAVVPTGLGIGFEIRRRLLEEPPAAALLIGSDLFNGFVGRWLRRHGVPTTVFFPPQVWLWEKFLRYYRSSYDLVLCSFPDEQTVYSRVGNRTLYVGHYLCDDLPSSTPAEQSSARRRLDLDGAGTVVGIFPGSRAIEVERLAPALFAAASQLLSEDSGLRFVVAVALPEYETTLRRLLALEALEERVVLTADSRAAMRASDLLLLCSGTATLEATLVGVPMISVYRVSWLTLGLLKLFDLFGLMQSKGNVALPNVLSRRTLVPEVQQSKVKGSEIARQARRLLADPERRAEMCRDLASIRDQLQVGNTLGKVAAAVLEGLGD